MSTDPGSPPEFLPETARGGKNSVRQWVFRSCLIATCVLAGAFIYKCPRTASSALRAAFNALPDIAAILLGLILAAAGLMLPLLTEELKRLEGQRKTRVRIAVVLLATAALFGAGGVISNYVQREEESARTEAYRKQLFDTLEGSGMVPRVMVGPCLPIPSPYLCDVNFINKDKLPMLEVVLKVTPALAPQDTDGEIMSKIAKTQQVAIGTVHPGLNATTVKIFVGPEGARYDFDIHTKRAHGLQRVRFIWERNHLLNNVLENQTP
jgi:hypothetical protein